MKFTLMISDGHVSIPPKMVSISRRWFTSTIFDSVTKNITLSPLYERLPLRTIAASQVMLQREDLEFDSGLLFYNQDYFFFHFDRDKQFQTN